MKKMVLLLKDFFGGETLAYLPYIRAYDFKCAILARKAKKVWNVGW